MTLLVFPGAFGWKSARLESGLSGKWHAVPTSMKAQPTGARRVRALSQRPMGALPC